MPISIIEEKFQLKLNKNENLVTVLFLAAFCVICRNKIFNLK